MQRAICSRLSRSVYWAATSNSPGIGGSVIGRAPIATLATGQFQLSHQTDASHRALLSYPWSATQLRQARFSGADVRPGNVIERKGKIYQVVKAQHTTQGRGGAIIQVELRDVDSGNKLNERFRTDEAIEKVFVEEKSYDYLYTDDDTVVLVEPETYVQINVPKHLFGDSVAYLQDDMKVTLQLFDGRPLSATIPTKVICTVAEAQVYIKGSTATPQYKKVKLDNGLTVQVPNHVLAGDRVIVNTTDNSYIGRKYIAYLTYGDVIAGPNSNLRIIYLIKSFFSRPEYQNFFSDQI